LHAAKEKETSVAKAQPARWAVSRFGRDVATQLMHAIPAAINTAVGRQMDGHQTVKLRTRHAFGGAWPARYEELAEHLRDVPGCQIVRPSGMSFEIALVNNIALLPVEYAKDLKTAHDSPRALRAINKTTLELAKQFGPAPTNVQLTLDTTDAQPEQPPTDILRGLEPDGIVIIYYAAHERQGLLNIGWGEISVNADGIPQWVASQPLQVPSAPAITGLRVLVDPSASRSAPRFDQARLDSPTLRPRTPGQQVAPPGDQPHAEQPRLHAQD
jgi:hypothetical protein